MDDMSLKESILLYLREMWETHPAKCACTAGGVLLAVCILLFGFWNMLFVIILGAVGCFIGANMDREGDTLQNILDCIPKDIHRLR